MRTPQGETRRGRHEIPGRATSSGIIAGAGCSAAPGRRAAPDTDGTDVVTPCSAAFTVARCASWTVARARFTLPTGTAIAVEGRARLVGAAAGRRDERDKHHPNAAREAASHRRRLLPTLSRWQV